MAILSDEAKALIAENTPGMIATACESGKPNVAPFGSFRVVDDEHVMFANVHSHGTLSNVTANPQVCAIVYNPGNRHGCRVWGTATVHTSGEQFDATNAWLGTLKMSCTEIVMVHVDSFVTF